MAQRLLHTNRQAVHDDADCATLVVTFSQYFVKNISQIRASISSALQSMTVRHFEVRRHAGPTLVRFSEVTVDEVRRLLSKMPSKSSPLDVLPCSLMKSCHDVLPRRSPNWPTCHSGLASFRPATSVHRYCRFCRRPVLTHHHRRTIGRSRT